MCSKDILISDANKRQVVAIHKLYRSLMRILNKTKLTPQELYVIADNIDVPRGLIRALKRNEVDDMTLTDYFRLKEFLYSTSIEDIQALAGKNNTFEVELDEEDETDIDEKLDNEAFIDKINKSLPKEAQINKEEALNAKKVFDEDNEPEIDVKVNVNGKELDQKELTQFTDAIKKALSTWSNKPEDDAKKLKEKTMSDYDKAVKEAQMELFGNTELLTNKTIGELKYYIYRNGWDKEFDMSLINHRQEVLIFLYKKLEEATSKKIGKVNNLTKADMDNYQKCVDMAKKQYKKDVKEAQKKVGGNEPKSVTDELNELMGMLGKFGFKF